MTILREVFIAYVWAIAANVLFFCLAAAVTTDYATLMAITFLGWPVAIALRGLVILKNTKGDSNGM